jgi:hypothetical protein
MKAYKATVEVLFAAPGDGEANLLLGHMRFAATGALNPMNAPECVASEVKEMKQVPRETRVHDLLDRLKAEDEARR